MAAELLKPTELSKEALMKNCGDDAGRTAYLHSVVYSLVIGSGSIEDFVQDFKEVIATHPDIPTTLLDCIWLVENELVLLPSQNSANNNKQHIERLALLVRSLAQFLPSLARERLDPELLEASKLIQSKDVFAQKIVRVKTRLFYKQQKFNLLREESEGYSKLIAELANPVSGTSREGSSRSADYLRSLIGCFGLDPNRVLDLVLESFILDLKHTDFFIELLRSITNDRTSVSQILGRKFSIPEKTSPALATASARLLCKDLVDMDILYAHLSPSDADITAKVQSDLNDAKQKLAGLSVISLGGKTEEDTSTANGTNKTDGKEKSPAAPADVHALASNQKLLLLHALLCEGAWPEARRLLDHMTPTYAMAEPAVSLAMSRYLSAMIAPLYEKYHGLPDQLLKSVDSTGGQTKSPSDKKLPKLDGSKICLTHEDMVKHGFFATLFYIGPYLSRDSILMIRLLRVFNSFIQTITPTKLAPDSWQAKFYFSMITAFDDVVLPSLSLMSSNCVVSEHIWSVLKQIPYLHRYSLYGSWLSDAYSNLAPLIIMRVAVTEKCRYSVKRVTKDNFKQIGRQLGKLSHANPGPVIDHLLATVQKFDNFIGPLIDSLRYMTQMSFDVMTYCVIRTLAAAGSDQTEGAAALCSFTGQLVRRYNCEIAGLLQLVTNQLKVGTCEVDLALLREIVQKMAGIEPSEDATDDQMEAAMGGDILKSEIGNLFQLKSLKRPAQRLRDCLAEASLATPVFLLVAKHRPTAIYKSPMNTHLKTLGKMFDECQETFLQYGTFLSNVLTTNEYANAVPSVYSLLSEYKVPPDSAFFMARPILAGKIGEQTKVLTKHLSTQANKDGGSKPDKESIEKIKTQAFCEASRSVFSELAASVRQATANSVSCFPPNLWDELSCDLYVVFWTLDVSDIYVPEGAYDRLEQIARNQLKTAETELQSANNGNSSSSTVKGKAKERDRLKSSLDRVLEERNRQREHVARVMACLKEMKDRFFPTELLKRDVIANFLQYCVFPRLLFSQPDAVFCAKFISLLHSMLLPNFSTVHCLDRIFCDITYVLSSLSEAESRRYGRFVAACLELVLQWHGSREVYDRECGTRFIISQSNSVKTPLDYENFRHLCHKWNYRISKAMVSCLESGQYVQIRNALVVLTKLLPVYPKLANHGQALEQRADRLSRAEKEHRADLYQLAFAYGGQLRAKKSTWVQERDFHIMADATPTKTAPSSGQPPAETAPKDAQKRSEPQSTATTTSKRTAQQSTAAATDGVPAKRAPTVDSVVSTNNTSSTTSTPQRTAPVDETNGHGREDTKRRRIENGQAASATSSPAHTTTVSSTAVTANGTTGATTTTTANGTSGGGGTAPASSKKQSAGGTKDASRQSGRDSRKRSSPSDKTLSDVVVPPAKQQHSAAVASGGTHSPSPTTEPAHQSSRQASSRGASKQSGGSSAVKQSSTQAPRGSGGTGSRRH